MAHIVEPEDLDLETIEAIEKLTLRGICQGVLDFGFDAWRIFHQSPDKVKDIAEDITRELLDRFSGYFIEQRLFGNVDYRSARYILLPEFGVRQALFVDSKAEKDSSSGTLQMSQLSLRVRQSREGLELDEQGKLDPVSVYKGVRYLTSTMLVHYHYADLADVEDPSMIAEAESIDIPSEDPNAEEQVEIEAGGEEEEEERIPAGSPLHHVLKHITVAAIPNGFLQDRYNPSAVDGIWNVGRNAPKLGEDFRVRLAFAKLKQKAAWRVQTIAYDYPNQRLNFEWKD